MRKTNLLLSFLVLLLLAIPQARAQTTFTILPDTSKVTIDGTSNKTPHWTVTAEDFSGHVKMSENVDPADPGITEVVLNVTAKEIKSHKSSIMDRLMYKALKVDNHPEVTYALTSAEVTASEGDTFTLLTRGDLTMAGNTKEIEMTVEGEKLPGGEVRFVGSYPMKMSEHNMKAPTAMFGALRTGDELVVNIDLITKKE